MVNYLAVDLLQVPSGQVSSYYYPSPAKEGGGWVQALGCESIIFFFSSTVLGGKGRGLIFRQEGPCWALSYLVFFMFYFICHGKSL